MVRDWCKYVRIYEKVMVHILHYNAESFKNRIQNQPPIGVLWKSCCENMQQIYRRTPMQKCDFNKVALHFGMGVGCSPVNFCIFSEKLLLRIPLDGCFCRLLQFISILNIGSTQTCIWDSVKI